MLIRLRTHQKNLVRLLIQEHVFQTYLLGKLYRFLMRYGEKWCIEIRIAKMFKYMKIKKKINLRFDLLISTLINGLRNIVQVFPKRFGSDLRYIPVPVFIASQYNRGLKSLVQNYVKYRNKRGQDVIQCELISLKEFIPVVLTAYMDRNRAILWSRNNLYQRIWLNRTLQHFRWK